MIPNEKGWHYLAVKKMSALLRGITSKDNDIFYCLNCLHSFRTENLNVMKNYVRVCKTNLVDFCSRICQLKKICMY